MATLCRTYTETTDAHEMVERMLAAGVAAADVRLLMGRLASDARELPHGTYAGGMPAAVGSFGGTTRSSRDGMGDFAGRADRRQGGFGDADRDVVTRYDDAGVEHRHVASHRELRRLLLAAGLEGAAVDADVAALHDGRVLVLVETRALGPADLAAAASGAAGA